MKKITQFAMSLAAVLALGMPGAWAASVDDTDTVTITVNNILSISDEVGPFTLAFDNDTGTVSGSASTGQTVGYLVQANNLPNAAVAGALSAKISALLDGITFRANSGMAYNNTGSSGNAILAPVDSGPVVIGTATTALADKPASTGAQGKVLNGTYFVNWGAIANRDLSDTDGGAVALTVTLKDV